MSKSIVRVGSESKRSRLTGRRAAPPATLADDSWAAAMERLDSRVELIRALIPLGAAQCEDEGGVGQRAVRNFN